MVKTGMMRYYPVFLDLMGKTCVVVGGGAVAARKVEGLLAAGASVTVISPKAGVGVNALAKAGAVTLIKRRYRRGDLKAAFLVISATDLAAVNKAVFEEASSLNILVNCVDGPQLCGFIVPAVVDRGELVIAVSTSGRYPALSARIRREIEAVYGHEYGLFLEILGGVRRKILKSSMKRDKKERVINELATLATSPILSWIKDNDTAAINGFLRRLLGAGYTLRGLGVRLDGKAGCSARL